MKILVTGCCGFIGYHVSKRLLENDFTVIGIDNFDDYYDIKFKENRLNILKEYKNFKFEKGDIINSDIISREKPNKVCHLASKAGVRNSLIDPKSYIKNNIEGFINLLEDAVKNDVENFVYASSSSVYGLNEKVPFCEDDILDSCNSPYAASKISMEIFAKTYSQLYDLTLIGLRFFTVFGPEGRPDMAPFKFLKSILNEEKFFKFGDGNSKRDYTYIDDIVNGVILALENKNKLKCEVFNLGNSSPVTLNEFIKKCEHVTGKKAIYEEIENQKGDVPVTYADITKAKSLLCYRPKITLDYGILKTCEWIKNLK